MSRHLQAAHKEEGAIVAEPDDRNTKNHWEHVYGSRPATEVSWFQPHASMSMNLLLEAHAIQSASIIDIGGGASTFADDLIDAGYLEVTVLDVSRAALDIARLRLGPRGSSVRWIEADVLDAQLPEQGFDVWHDRASFHFLTSEIDRRQYVRAVIHSLKPGGTLIVATFADDGPPKCSGLPVMRYNPSSLQAEFGPAFELVHHVCESHRTPGGSVQPFVYCRWRRPH